MRFFSYAILIIGMLLASSLVGCTSNKALNLMPTPVIYQNSQIDPFAHLTPELKSPQTHVFYATIELLRPQNLEQVMAIN